LTYPARLYLVLFMHKVSNTKSSIQEAVAFWWYQVSYYPAVQHLRCNVQILTRHRVSQHGRQNLLWRNQPCRSQINLLAYIRLLASRCYIRVVISERVTLSELKFEQVHVQSPRLRSRMQLLLHPGYLSVIWHKAAQVSSRSCVYGFLTKLLSWELPLVIS
jgi:hypothetical protein